MVLLLKPKSRIHHKSSTISPAIIAKWAGTKTISGGEPSGESFSDHHRLLIIIMTVIPLLFSIPTMEVSAKNSTAAHMKRMTVQISCTGKTLPPSQSKHALGVILYIYTSHDVSLQNVYFISLSINHSHIHVPLCLCIGETGIQRAEKLGEAASPCTWGDSAKTGKHSSGLHACAGSPSDHRSSSPAATRQLTNRSLIQPSSSS